MHILHKANGNHTYLWYTEKTYVTSASQRRHVRVRRDRYRFQQHSPFGLSGGGGRRTYPAFPAQGDDRPGSLRQRKGESDPSGRPPGSRHFGAVPLGSGEDPGGGDLRLCHCLSAERGQHQRGGAGAVPSDRLSGPGPQRPGGGLAGLSGCPAVPGGRRRAAGGHRRRQYRAGGLPAGKGGVCRVHAGGLSESL